MIDTKTKRLVMKFNTTIPLDDVDEVIAIVNKDYIDGHNYVEDIKEIDVNVRAYLWFKYNVGHNYKESTYELYS